MRHSTEMYRVNLAYIGCKSDINDQNLSNAPKALGETRLLIGHVRIFS